MKDIVKTKWRSWGYALLSTFLFLGCSPDSSDLDTWEENGDVSKIKNFVSDGIHADQPNEVVLHGVDVLADVGADSTLRKIGSAIGQNIPREHAGALIQALNRRSLVPGSTKELCKLAVEEKEFEGLGQLLRRHQSSELSGCVKEMTNGYQFPSDADGIHDRLVEVNEKYGVVTAKIDTMRKTLKMFIESDRKISELERKISRKKDSLDYKNEKEGRLEEIIENSKEISGYIVSLLEKRDTNRLYEFAFVDYGGRPTRERGYLLTKETKFRSKGTFEMRVKKVKEVKTKLKDEMGGFEQSWPLYSEIVNYDEKKSELDRLKEETKSDFIKVKLHLPEEKRKIERKKRRHKIIYEKYTEEKGESSEYRAGPAGIGGEQRQGPGSSEAGEALPESEVAMSGVGPARSGWYAGSGPEASVEAAWEVDIETSSPYAPSVVGETLYIAGKIGDVYALDTKTGRQQWQFESADTLYGDSSPAVVGGSVFVGRAGDLLALDAETGQEQWRFETEDENTNLESPSVSSPAVVEGTVYVSSQDHNVYALDAETGQEQWRFNTGDRVISPPAVVRGTVYVGNNNNYVFALDAETGQKQWRFYTGGQVFSSPAVVEGIVYVGAAGGNIYALDTETGLEQWHFEAEVPVGSSPAVAQGTVYIKSRDDNIYALDAETGQEQWRSDVGDGGSSPVVAGGIVYVDGENRGRRICKICALDAETGQEQWCFEIGGREDSPPTVSGGTVYVDGEDDSVIALQ